MERPSDVPEWYEYGTINVYSAQAERSSVAGSPIADTYHLCVAMTSAGRTERIYYDGTVGIKNDYGSAGWLVESEGQSQLATPMAPEWLRAKFTAIPGIPAKMLVHTTYLWYQIRRRHLSVGATQTFPIGT